MSSAEKKYIGAIDQGTTSTRFMLFDKQGKITAMKQLEHSQIFPQPGWVEHDPMEIKAGTEEVIRAVMAGANIRADQVASIGITNQRETTLVWNRRTGKPYYNAIVWQDTRTADICKELAKDGDMNCYREIVGLPLSTYFAGPKIKWILDNVSGVREAAENGDALFGTIDSWIIWWLTGGPVSGIHMTDVTNASRTMLMNLETLQWDEEMLDVMGIPGGMLPDIRSSSEVYGYTDKTIFEEPIAVAGVLGDQQAALFGQSCFEEGEMKNTYGTGCFLLLNTGNKIIHSKYGLITTLGFQIGKNKPVYALEGSVALAGSLVQWLRDNMGLIKSSSEIEELAAMVEDNGGIYFVPAFSGLYAPHWNSEARGLLIGLSHFINKGHIARAVLEATAFQTWEIFEAMQKDTNVQFKDLKVDGGMVVNEILMQFQADILGVNVVKPCVSETTALGAAYAAGLAVGFWKDTEELKKNWQKEKVWKPGASEDRHKLCSGWLKAVNRSMDWIGQ